VLARQSSLRCRKPVLFLHHGQRVIECVSEPEKQFLDFRFINNEGGAERYCVADGAQN
jgi:hypothetical protein